MPSIVGYLIVYFKNCSVELYADGTERAICSGIVQRAQSQEENGYRLLAPVSNSGRLKQQILELLGAFSFEVEAEVINDVDVTLEKLENVVTSDAIILDKCRSWVNLNAKLIEEMDDIYPLIDFGGLYQG